MQEFTYGVIIALLIVLVIDLELVLKELKEINRKIK